MSANTEVHWIFPGIGCFRYIPFDAAHMASWTSFCTKLCAVELTRVARLNQVQLSRPATSSHGQLLISIDPSRCCYVLPVPTGKQSSNCTLWQVETTGVKWSRLALWASLQPIATVQGKWAGSKYRLENPLESTYPFAIPYAGPPICD